MKTIFFSGDRRARSSSASTLADRRAADPIEGRRDRGERLRVRLSCVVAQAESQRGRSAAGLHLQGRHPPAIRGRRGVVPVANDGGEGVQDVRLLGRGPDDRRRWSWRTASRSSSWRIRRRRGRSASSSPKNSPAPFPASRSRRSSRGCSRSTIRTARARCATASARRCRSTRSWSSRTTRSRSATTPSRRGASRRRPITCRRWRLSPRITASA